MIENFGPIIDLFFYKKWLWRAHLKVRPYEVYNKQRVWGGFETRPYKIVFRLMPEVADAGEDHCQIVFIG